MAGYYHTNILPWTVIPAEDHRFRVVVKVALVLYVVAALVVSIIEIPKPPRVVEQTALPPQLAKLILEKEKPKPPPPPVEEKKKEEEKPKKEEKKKEEKKEEKKKPEEKKPEPIPVEPEKPKVDLDAARKKAAKSGLLALSDDLADLREAPTVSLSKNISVNKNPSAPKGPASEPQLLTLATKSGSRGVDTSALARANVRSSGGELAGRATENVESPVEAQAKLEQKSSGKNAGRVLPRTFEEIQLTFDKYKGVIQNMYQKALRTDPGLKGKVVLEFTIAPSGAVTHCRIVSSELDAPDLMEKLVTRVKAFNFGEKAVEEMTLTYPIDFAPIS